MDGVALAAAFDAAFDAWAGAAGTDTPTAFRVAEEVRSVAKGLGGSFPMTNGWTLPALRLSVAVGR